MLYTQFKEPFQATSNGNPHLQILFPLAISVVFLWTIIYLICLPFVVYIQEHIETLCEVQPMVMLHVQGFKIYQLD